MYKKPTFLYYFKKDSIIFKIWFLRKFILFLSLSIFAFINKNFYLNAILLILFLTSFFILWFFRRKKRILRFLVLSSFVLCFMRLLFTKTANGKILFIFPWHTYITTNTIHLMLLAVTKRLLIITTWIFFMIITSEDELISFLLKNKISKKFVFILSISLNTFWFVLRDSEIVSHALKSRIGYKRWFLVKMRNFFLILKTLFLSSIKRIDTLNNAFYFKKDNYKKNA